MLETKKCPELKYNINPLHWVLKIFFTGEEGNETTEMGLVRRLLRISWLGYVNTKEVLSKMVKNVLFYSNQRETLEIYGTNNEEILY